MDWNVVVTVYDREGRRRIRRFLSRYGDVAGTEFHNVLVARVPDIAAFLEAVSAAIRQDASILNDISRLIPAQVTFAFASVAEFEANARAVVREWAGRMAGGSFYVRLHRRRGDSPVKLSAHTEERLLDDAVLDRMRELGRPGKVSFTDPDYVIDIETVGERAGMSLWSREEINRFPFLRVD